MYAVDYFCGAGGFTRGLLNSGISVILGIDNDEDYGETYKDNNNVNFLLSDIRKLEVEVVEESIKDIDRNDLLFVACAPCQPFTKLKSLKESGELASLLIQFGRFVKYFLPRQLIIENVPGFTKVKGASTYRRFITLLNRLGYNYCEGVVDAKNYGVPQTRRRYILIATQLIKPYLPNATHGPGLIPYMTVEEAIKRYPHIAAGESHLTVPNHRSANLSKINLERIKSTPHDGGDRRNWPKKLWLDCHSNGHSGHTDVYGRMFWKKPSPALTCKCYSLSNGRYGHPIQDRAISLREAAALQSFNDDYVFYGSTLQKLGNQIGNAVPVKLAEALGLHIQSIFDQN